MAWEHRRRTQQGAKIFQEAKWSSSAFPMIFPSSCASATCGRDQTLWIQQRLQWQKGSCRCWTRCPRLTFAVVPRSSPSCYAALNLGGFFGDMDQSQNVFVTWAFWRGRGTLGRLWRWRGGGELPCLQLKFNIYNLFWHPPSLPRLVSIIAVLLRLERCDSGW